MFTKDNETQGGNRISCQSSRIIFWVVYWVMLLASKSSRKHSAMHLASCTTASTSIRSYGSTTQLTTCNERRTHSTQTAMLTSWCFRMKMLRTLTHIGMLILLESFMLMLGIWVWNWRSWSPDVLTYCGYDGLHTRETSSRDGPLIVYPVLDFTHEVILMPLGLLIQRMSSAVFT